MDSVLVAVLGALACLMGLGGFALGLFAYSHVYGHFRARMEDEAKRARLTLEVGERQREARLKEMQERVRRAYGRLEPEQEEAVNEEIEKILSAGPRAGNGA